MNTKDNGEYGNISFLTENAFLQNAVVKTVRSTLTFYDTTQSKDKFYTGKIEINEKMEETVMVLRKTPTIDLQLALVKWMSTFEIGLLKFVIHSE